MLFELLLFLAVRDGGGKGVEGGGKGGGAGGGAGSRPKQTHFNNFI